MVVKKSCVAACLKGWPNGRGISGRMCVEWVAGSAWNRWPDGRGIRTLGCELVSALLYHFVFDLHWQPHPWLLVLPVIGALLIGGAGVLGTRRALNASPLEVLREG